MSTLTYFDPLTLKSAHAEMRVKFAKVTSGANASIVSAVTGYKIRVVACWLLNGHASNISAAVWESPADTAISGNIVLGASAATWAATSLILPFNPVGWFEGAASGALVLDTTAGTVTGGIAYIEVPN